MSTYSPQTAAQEPSLATVRELVRAYQAFSSYSESFVRQYDLTPAQFDVIATLGNTAGLSMGEIGENLNHPTEEHLLPLFDALGAGGHGRQIHHGFTYGAFSMAAYAFD